MSFSDILFKIGDVGLCLAVIVATVFLIDAIKGIIEHFRLKKTHIEIVDGVELRKFENGKVYKKLTRLYQALAFFVAFAGIFCVLYFYSKMRDIFTLVTLSALIAGAEAKAYEVYEGGGLRGLFRWVAGMFHSSSNVKDIGADTKSEDILDIMQGAADEIKEELLPTAESAEIDYEEMDKKVVQYLAKRSGKDEEFVRAVIENIGI